MGCYTAAGFVVPLLVQPAKVSGRAPPTALELLLLPFAAPGVGGC